MTTAHTVNFKGTPITVPNKVTQENKQFHISYNNRDIESYGGATTALYINETGQFLILNGDHRKEYNKQKTLKDCLNYFYNNIDKANNNSEHNKIFKMIEGKAKYIQGGY